MDGDAADERSVRLLHGDVLERLKAVPNHSCALVISSPPYNIRKPYERNDKRSLQEYTSWQSEIVSSISDKLSADGSICWQVGTYVSEGELFPLDLIFLDLFRKNGFKLRNRIIWRYNFGLNADRRFSGRYETLLWLTKSDDYYFNLDPVRIPQLYPGKRHSKARGDKAGKPSGNPLGKNPSDYWEFSAAADFKENPVWDIPNVKSKHPEKTDHPCQFPVELAERCVLALSKEGDRVLDPFLGTGASLIAAVKHGRTGTGIDREQAYLDMAEQRLADLVRGILPMRPLGMPVRRPRSTERVAQTPREWTEMGESEAGEGGLHGKAA